ncbi:AraC family transcriptional regulator [Lentzea sp. NEAU-D7]|uniref:AraC family transcriptional regulator n=1 Tax=Lentzea sp. NEAU-D7 TaxID=2994667 RepID=UPI00224B0134|nr:AraC family transcriptional regulator [Lentzea sp. NEAU-D7]MCX2947700.1 AraC family transcriptional regulator [Lentzea sp. NEAU-D7]
MSPLEQVLSELSVNWVVTTPLHAGGRWALHFVGRLDLRVEVVVRGRAHVTVAGESFWAEQGDCYVIAGRRPYRIAADPDTPSVFAAPCYEDEHGKPRDRAQVGEGHDTTLVGAGFTCEPEDARLLGVLPPVIHVRAGAAAATIDLIRSEIGGGGMILDRLCQVLLLQVLRDHVTDDPGLGPAFEAMRADLRHPWTVAELAGIAAMSRSTFFVRFRENTGLTPLDFLYRMRMRHAARLLRDTTGTVASIAAASGYRTESAFGAAFRRFAGRSPGEYRTRIVT